MKPEGRLSEDENLEGLFRRPVNVRVGNLDVTDLLKNHLAYPTSVHTNHQYSEVIILKKNGIKRKIQNENPISCS